MLKLSSIKSFPLLSPCSPCSQWFFLLNPGLELSYSLTAPVAFVELGVSAARCWLVIDPGGLLRSRRGRREDFLAIPGQRRINPLAVDELLGPLRRFAFRDDNAFPALGIHGPHGPRSSTVTYQGMRSGSIGRPNRSQTTLCPANLPMGRPC